MTRHDATEPAGRGDRERAAPGKDRERIAGPLPGREFVRGDEQGVESTGL
jgi:hypothetical protein